MHRHLPAASAVALAATFFFGCSKSEPEDVTPETPSVSTEAAKDTMQTGAAAAQDTVQAGAAAVGDSAAAVGDSAAAVGDSAAATIDTMAAPAAPSMDSAGTAVGDSLAK